MAAKLNSDHVELLATALIREYLSRKGLKNSLATLDAEQPRCENSITNRVELAKQLHIEKLLKKNKESCGKQYKTMVEVIAKHYLEKHSSTTRQKERKSASSKSEKTMSTVNKVDIESEDVYYLITNPRQQCDSNVQDITGTDRKDSETAVTTTDRNVCLKVSQPDEEIFPDHNSGTEDCNLVMSDNSGKRYPNLSKYVGRQHNSTDANRDLFAKNMKAALLDDSLDLYVKKRPESLQTLRQMDGCFTVQSPSTKSQKRLQAIEVAKETKLGERLQNENATINYQHPSAFVQDNQIALTMGSKVLDSKKNASATNENSQVELNAAELFARKHKCVERIGDIEIDDLEDLDDDLSGIDVGHPIVCKRRVVVGTPITLDTACALKSLIFGSAMQRFSMEWQMQGFSFCDLPELQYGLVQKKGGPCGLLASVQACMLQHWLFSEEQCWSSSKKLAPTSEQRSKYLRVALASILWRAGSKKRAVVAVPSGKAAFVANSQYRCDQLTETLSLHTFDEFLGLEEFLRNDCTQYDSDHNGSCITFLYSVILSRGFDRLKADMDEPSNTLMGLHGYCTQEIVNLLLTGTAFSNVFDGTVLLDSGGAVSSLRGIPERSDIGFLSLFEHYGSCEVGGNYKRPCYPIWVVCSESHFTVLFALERDAVAHTTFDLHYYDGLAGQDEPIRLTVDTSTSTNSLQSHVSGLVPPLEHCIHTLWNDAHVDWNGYDPIL